MDKRVIAVVDDEEDVLHILDYNLRQAGYGTRLAMDGKGALEMIRQEPVPDLVLLDLMLPDISGIEICRRLRGRVATRAIPILMLTAKGQEVDRVAGFEAGADDYVVKPFFIREVVLRVGALLRRNLPDGEELVRGPIRLNRASHRVHVGQREVNLTPIEFQLLEALMSRKDRVRTREELLSEVWEMNPDIQTRTVNVHVNRIRDKLGDAGSCIETLHGVGYRFREQGPEGA